MGVHGLFLSWYDSGKPYYAQSYENGSMLGWQVWFYENGHKMREGDWGRDGEQTEWTYWHDNGQVWFEGKMTYEPEERPCEIARCWASDGEPSKSCPEDTEVEEHCEYSPGKSFWSCPPCDAMPNVDMSAEAFSDCESYQNCRLECAYGGEPKIEGNEIYCQNGPAVRWYEDGQLRERGFMVIGERHGPWTKWHDNGQKAAEGSYKVKKECGVWTCWGRDGAPAPCGVRNNACTETPTGAECPPCE